MRTPKFFAPSRSRMSALLAIGALLTLLVLSPGVTGAQEMSHVAKVLNQELSILEYDFVPLVEAMPADKYDFTPTTGEFKGVRTFAQQVGHTAQAVYKASAAMLEEKVPAGLGGGENGPDSLKTKADLVVYLKGAFTYAHKAMAKLTAANLTDEVQAEWGKAPRLFMADLVLWHSFDHYGQLVVYLRMNGIVPPASRPKK
jgi:hypothetical protein